MVMGWIRRVLFGLVTLGLAAGTVVAIYLSVTLIRVRSNNPTSSGPGPVPLPGILSSTAGQGPRGNTLVPGLKAPRFGGGELSLADLHGKGVVMNFFASWCVPVPPRGAGSRGHVPQVPRDGCRLSWC